MTNPAAEQQGAPVKNETTFVQVQVIDDINAMLDLGYSSIQRSTRERVIRDEQDRLQHGIQKYGTGLQVNNGRNATMDAYQEALDLVNYLKQAVLEKKLPEWMYRKQLEFVMELATWVQR